MLSHGRIVYHISTSYEKLREEIFLILPNTIIWNLDPMNNSIGIMTRRRIKQISSKLQKEFALDLNKTPKGLKKFYILENWCKITGNKFTQLPIPTLVIDRLYAITVDENMTDDPTFTNADR